MSLGPSESLAKDIALAPVVGEGSIALTWTISGSVDGSSSIEGSLVPSSGQSLSISVPSTSSGGGPLRFEDLASGSWKLELRLLRNGSALCGLADALVVAAGMETKAVAAFKPPSASLSMAFGVPDYSAIPFQVEPSLRLASRGTSMVFRAPGSGKFSWYEEGLLLPGSGPELRYEPGGAPGLRRLDCVIGGSSLPRSGTAQARLSEAQSFGAACVERARGKGVGERSGAGSDAGSGRLP